MQYVFGNKKDIETLRTKDISHTNLSGNQQIIMDYPDSTITDTFYVKEKFDSQEDAEGNCYDWYYITNHNRNIDKTNAIKKMIAAVTPYTETKMAYIGDTEVTFYTEQAGNLTVFFDKPYTVERLADRITVSFEELEEVTEVTISIL